MNFRIMPLLLFLCFALLSSCKDENIIIESYYKDFPQRRWYTDKEVKVEIDIINDSQKQHIYVVLRHVYGYQLSNLDMDMTINGPGGITSKSKINLAVKNSSGGYNSHCAGDICDLETLIDSDIVLQKGKYTFTFKHNMPYNPLPNIMELGVMVTKEKLELIVDDLKKIG
jgi:gliding motility-associated lipoprotein GldH